MTNENLLKYFQDNLDKHSFEALKKEALKSYSLEEIAVIENKLKI